MFSHFVNLPFCQTAFKVMDGKGVKVRLSLGKPGACVTKNYRFRSKLVCLSKLEKVTDNLSILCNLGIHNFFIIQVRLG